MAKQVKENSSKNNASNKKQVMTGNKRIWMIAGLSVIVLVIISAVFLQRKKDDVVAYVAGEPIMAKELSLQVNNNKGLVSAYFSSKYNADSSKDFWTTDFSGEVPADRLMKDAMDSALRNKILQIMAKERGLVKDINYSSLLNKMNKENKDRQKALDNNEVVIGLEQYDEKTYYDINMSNLTNSLLDVLSSELTVSDEDIQANYEANKDKYASMDSITIGKLSVSYEDGKNITREEAQKQAQELKNQLKSGMELTQLKSALTDQATYEEILLGSSESRNISLIYPLLFQKSMGLSPGQFSDVFEEDNAFNIGVCIDRTNDGYQSLEDVKNTIRESLLGEQFEQMVAQRVAEAEVKINYRVYNRLKKEAIR